MTFAQLAIRLGLIHLLVWTFLVGVALVAYLREQQRPLLFPVVIASAFAIAQAVVVWRALP